MSRYALTVTAMGYTIVLQVLETDGSVPATPADEPSSVWREVPNGMIVEPGMKTDWGSTYSDTSDYERQAFTSGRIQLRLDQASRWLMFNPLQYKLDLEIATAAEAAALVAYKQYYIAVTEVINQNAFPTINWPVAPF
ncbi:tail fiber assembly protein [Pseudomonas sp. FP2196]|nr:tail fiber assembly protein [Pseudomonas sp. FP2196]WLH36811.1 tail fiber assembly protein [Pseudomonas sp. FP2196]